MKKLIKDIPWFGNLVVNVYRKIRGTSFTTSAEYWENRYRSGGNSGAGSYNNLAQFKAKVINEFLQKNNIQSVIEFGCGDGNQLRYLQLKQYSGYDVSETVLKRCKELFQDDNTKSFHLMNEYNGDTAELTMSLDVIYHLIEDDVFHNYMNTLFSASNQFVIIYSSNSESNQLSAPHEKNRIFTRWVEQNQPMFSLIDHIPNQYPYNGNGATTSESDFYIYEKTE